MPWWAWLAAFSICAAIAYGIIMTLVTIGPIVKRWYKHLKYAREAKRHNEEARQLRLQRTEYYGYPLPAGKEGTLRITSAMMIHNPHRVSSRMLERALMDRAIDLKADILVENDPITRAIVVTWRPHKGPRQKEKY